MCCQTSSVTYVWPIFLYLILACLIHILTQQCLTHAIMPQANLLIWIGLVIIPPFCITTQIHHDYQQNLFEFLWLSPLSYFQMTMLCLGRFYIFPGVVLMLCAILSAFFNGISGALFMRSSFIISCATISFISVYFWISLAHFYVNLSPAMLMVIGLPLIFPIIIFGVTSTLHDATHPLYVKSFQAFIGICIMEIMLSIKMSTIFLSETIHQ